MKTSFASTSLVLSVLIVSSYACSSSSSSGGGSSGGDTDAGATSSAQDSGGGTAQDSGGAQQQSACGTGTFTCTGASGAATCQIATQYCLNGLGCLAYTGSDPCPTCTNPPGECGVGKTSTCLGDDQSGVTISCD